MKNNAAADLNFFICGGAGFIGSNLTKYLYRNFPNCTVTVYDNLSSGSLDFFDSSLLEKISFINSDIKDLDVLTDAMNSQDIVFLLAANPDKAVQNVRRQVAKAISDVRKGGDLKKLNRMTQQLAKVQAIGGFKTIIPSEGLVFVYKGNTYKLTGAFAPVNQITGMMAF